MGSCLFSSCTGTSAFIIDLWGQHSGPYIQALHFIVMMGATASPQLAKLFLPTPSDAYVECLLLDEGPVVIAALNHANSSLALGDGQGAPNDVYTAIPVVHYHNSSLALGHGVNGTSTVVVTDDVVSVDNETVAPSYLSAHAQNMDVCFVYMLISVTALVGGALHGLNMCCSGCHVSTHIRGTGGPGSVPQNQTPEKHPTEETFEEKIKEPKSKQSQYLAMAALCLIVVFFAGLEEIFGAFVVKFSTEYLQWDSGTSRDLVTVFWGSLATARFLSTFLSYWLGPKILLGFCTVSTTVVTIVMTFTITLTSVTSVLVWLGIAFAGFSIGSSMGHALNIGRDHVTYSGVLSSVIFFSNYFGKIVTPPWVGFLLQSVGYDWFLYSSVIYASLMLFNYCILLIITQYEK